MLWYFLLHSFYSLFLSKPNTLLHPSGSGSPQPQSHDSFNPIMKTSPGFHTIQIPFNPAFSYGSWTQPWSLMDHSQKCLVCLATIYTTKIYLVKNITPSWTISLGDCDTLLCLHPNWKKALKMRWTDMLGWATFASLLYFTQFNHIHPHNTVVFVRSVLEWVGFNWFKGNAYSSHSTCQSSPELWDSE